MNAETDRHVERRNQYYWLRKSVRPFRGHVSKRLPHCHHVCDPFLTARKTDIPD